MKFLLGLMPFQKENDVALNVCTFRLTTIGPENSFGDM